MIRSLRNASRSGLRRGNILIVTLLLLALFATIGLTIVYYTKDLANQSQISAQAASNGILAFPDDGSVAFNAFLNALIYDQPASQLVGQNPSSIVGHSLMRTMYGGGQVANGVTVLSQLTVPWSGVGTFHETYSGNDRALYVNYAALGGGLFPETSISGAYVPKNAPYTYPDIKDLYLASFVPATGEVLVPSFYRSLTFRGNGQPPTATGLEPTNPNWYNSPAPPGTVSAYKALICRPRPADNLTSPGGSSNFPMVPPNADGTYTGDVQNLVGSYVCIPATAKTPAQFVAHNDSIWIDIGLPPMTLLNGKTVKPLVAPLIVDLDALMNYYVHGNSLSALNAGSGAGMGPWEINLVRALQQPNGTNDATSLINQRTFATLSGQYNGSKSYNTRLASGQYLPTYAAVSWDTGAGANFSGIQLPGTNGAANASYYVTSPYYSLPDNPPTSYTGYDSTNIGVPGHAALLNPTEYQTPTGGTFPISDLQSLLSQYANTPYNYQPTNPSAGNAPGLLTLGGPNVTAPSIRGNSLLPVSQGGFPFPFTTPPPGSPTVPYFGPPQPQQGTPSNYPLDPALINRGLLTPYSFALDFPGLSPNFLNLTGPNPKGFGGTSLSLTFNAQSMLNGAILTNSAAGAFPTPTNPTNGTISDYASSSIPLWYNSRAALGPLDLNRPLADYRGNTSSPLAPTNMIGVSPYVGNYNNINYSSPPYVGTLGTQTLPQAVIDRQQFAMSIFVRLVVASGADASYYGAPGSPTYPNAISGIGDSIWFPNGPPAPGSAQFNALRALAQIAANIVDYIDSDDVSTAFVWNPTTPNDPLNPQNLSSLNAIGNSMVFGVEKPRLVLNEAFAEITNDPTDNALNNPVPPATKPPSPPATKNPYVRWWLEFVNPTSTAYSNGTGTLGTGAVKVRYTTTTDGVAASYSPYIVQMARSTQGGKAGFGQNISDLLRDPLNAGNAGNVTGAPARSVGPGVLIPVNPDLTFDFSAVDKTAQEYLYTVNPANPTNAQPFSPGSGVLVCAPAPTFLSSQQQANTGIPAGANPPPDWNPATGTWTFGSANVITGSSLNNPNNPNAGAFPYLVYNTIPLGAAIGGNGRVANGLNQNVVLLRRLANPYLPPNDPINPQLGSNPGQPINPYITVDYMDYVPATDQVLMLAGQNTKRTMGTESPLLYPQGPLQSLGKVQPYAGWTPINGGAQSPTTGTYQFQFPNSMVLPQQYLSPSSTPPPNLRNIPIVQNTFGYVNSVNPTAPITPSYTPGTGTGPLFTGKETLMTPYFWFPHMDRTLINQTELLQVSTGKPYEYTLRSIVPNSTGFPPPPPTDIQLNQQQTGPSYAYTLGSMMGMSPPNPNLSVPPVPPTNLLYRALDVLRIQPYGQMTALGGRVPGRININTIQDKRVWDAWLDAQSWNMFNQNDVTNMWYPVVPPKTPVTTLMSSRTPNLQPRYSPPSGTQPNGSQLVDTYGNPYLTPVPGPSIYDSPVATIGTDRPFLPFGAPTYTASPGGFAFQQGSGLQTDTLARVSQTLGSSYILQATNAIAATPGTQPYPHPYQQLEALRKILNNTTTVSHTFAVWATVGYFDYNAPYLNAAPVLGAEYYNVVPGDLRRKYFGVVDRSMVGLDPGALNGGQAVQNMNPPFFTTVDAVNASAGSNTIVITTSATGTGQVYSNGAAVNVQNQTPNSPVPTNWISIGTGATQEYTQVNGVSQYPPITNPKNPPTPTTGVTLLTLSTPLKFNHYQGESVSNIVPGFQGPGAGSAGIPSVGAVQGAPATGFNFNYSQQPFNSIVPFTVRLQ